MAEKKDGRYYLKKKIEELTKELNTEVKEHNALENKYEELKNKNEELQKTIEKQQSEISKLAIEAHESEQRRIKAAVAHEIKVDELFEHMGWWKRWTWRALHAEAED